MLQRPSPINTSKTIRFAILLLISCGLSNLLFASQTSPAAISATTQITTQITTPATIQTILPQVLFSPQDERTYQTERKLFQDAKKHLKKGNLRRFKAISKQLKDYPLYPYLEFFKLKRRIGKLTANEMDDFSQKNIDSPISYRLYNAWQASLVKNKRWKDYVATYESSGNAKYDCHYYWGLLKEGHTQKAFLGAEKLWLVGKSQKKACDPLFEAWKKTSAFNETIVWQRTQLAMQNRKLQLAKYLQRFLAEPEKSLSYEWRKLYRAPKRLQKISRYQQWAEKSKPLIISGFKRLILKDAALATELWPKYEASFNFSDSESTEIYQYFAKILASRFDDKAEYWLNKALVLPNSEGIIDYGIRHALRSHDWQRVKRWLAMTPKAERGSNQWRYWEAKSNQIISEFSWKATNSITPKKTIGTFEEKATPSPLLNANLDNFSFTKKENTTPLFSDLLKPHNEFIQHLARPDHTRSLLPSSTDSIFHSQQTPADTFETLSKERSFYGFIASELLDKPLQLNQRQITPTAEQLSRILSNPGIIRARELYKIKEDSYARSEWNLAIARMPMTDRGIAAQLASEWGWHHHAIMAAARSNIRDNLKLRFPTAHQNTVSSYAIKNGITNDWIFSLIRQESAFSQQAKSPVGALGMMQLMPATAKQVSKSIGVRYRGKHSLLLPEKNIQLGTTYMKQLQKRFQGNTILATAAYNAGPYRVKRWQPKNTPMAGDIWIETIPYKETRNYVKNVMTYQAIYRSHLGQEIKLANSLSLIPARSPQLAKSPTLTN